MPLDEISKPERRTTVDFASFVELKSRVSRLEEKHDDAIAVIKKLTEKVDALGQSIQRASWIVVGGGGVLYFLISGQLPKILGLAGGVQ
jgi:hypothetical protein